jgi:hypothetical protein
MPKHVEHDRQEYSRKNEKTNNRNGIGTVFGKIPLVRFLANRSARATTSNRNRFRRWNSAWALSRETLRLPWPNAWGVPHPVTRNESCLSCSNVNTGFAGRPKSFVG